MASCRASWRVALRWDSRWLTALCSPPEPPLLAAPLPMGCGGLGLGCTLDSGAATVYCPTCRFCFVSYICFSKRGDPQGVGWSVVGTLCSCLSVKAAHSDAGTPLVYPRPPISGMVEMTHGVDFSVVFSTKWLLQLVTEQSC